MAAFDPYRKWLGIPPRDQPPNFYRLLGVPVFESDPEVLANAADRQMVHVRSFQSGKYSELSQRILNELAAARVCLLDPEKKAAYDQELRREVAYPIPLPPPPPGLDAGAAAAMAVPRGPPLPPPPPPSLDPGAPGVAAAPPPPPPPPELAWDAGAGPPLLGTRRGRRSRSAWVGPLIALACLLAAVLGGIVLVVKNPQWTTRDVQRSPPSGNLADGSKLNIDLEPGRDSPRRPQDPTGATSGRGKRRLPGAEDEEPEGPDLDPVGPAARDPVPPDRTGRRKPKTPEPASPQQRLPVPDAQAQQKTENDLTKEVFKKDFEALGRLAGKPAAAEKLALARKLLEEGSKPQSNPATAFVLLRLSRDMAVEQADFDVAVAAVDQLGKQFDVKAAEMKAGVLQTIGEASLPTASRKLLSNKILALADEVLSADDHGTAERLVALARDNAAKARDGHLAKLAAARTQQIEQLRQEHQSCQAALELLAKDPADAQANLTVGSYYCFVKGDWQKGLPRLAASNDAELKPLAQADLALPQQTPERLALADGWWQVAEKRGGSAQHALRRHAAAWYKQVLPGLVGVEKTRVQQRLAEVGETPATGEAATLPPLSGLECRSSPLKETLLKTYGGTDSSQQAVERALDWLDTHQRTDGSWSFVHTTSWCRTQCPDPGTLDQAPNAATALALLPLLGAGHSQGHRQDKFQKTVANGIGFLKKRMVPVGAGATLYERAAPQMPSHALGTIALCEAITDAKTRAAANSAVKFIELTQNYDGGWGPKPKFVEPTADPSDVTVTLWNLAALKTAQWAGLPVSEKTLKQAEGFLDKMALSDKSGYRLTADANAADPYATASAMLGRMYLGWPREQPELVGFVGQTGRAGPSTGGRFYLNYLDGQALREVGGPTWLSWNAPLRDHLVATQNTEGHGAGSWFVSGRDWGNRLGGRLFCTAIGALILETYYRHPPLYK